MTEVESISKIKKLLEDWISKQGHDACWYYPDIFEQICQIVGVDSKNQNLPPRQEFECGCKKYQDKVYKDIKNDV